MLFSFLELKSGCVLILAFPEMNHDDTTTSASVNTPGGNADDTCPRQSGIVRIGVKSATGRKEDKIVRLSINIPNYRKNISVEVPLHKILEDDDDDFDDDDDHNDRTFNESSEGAMCSRCQMMRNEESSKMITFEIKTSLRQLLLSKLLERLAKKTLLRNYEKLIAREVEEQIEVSRNLPLTCQDPENLSIVQEISLIASETGNLNQTQLDETGQVNDVILANEQAFAAHANVQNVELNDQVLEKKDERVPVESREGICPSISENDEFFLGDVKCFSDVATETTIFTEKVDKSTTIHKDESTQTGKAAEISLDYHSDVKHRPKQPSSVSSSCQTDVEAPSSRAGSEDSKLNAIPGQATISSHRAFERINGELEESERDEAATPRPHESNSFRKSSFHHDDSATETESVSSSFMSSVSSSAFHSRPNKDNLKTVMSLSNEVVQACQNRFTNSDAKNSKKVDSQSRTELINKLSKSTAASKVETPSIRSKDSKPTVKDLYIKNIGAKGTSEELISKESSEDAAIRHHSKDNESFNSPSTTTKIEQTSTCLPENAQNTQQKTSTRGRSLSLKPPAMETKRLFDFGVDYTKTKQSTPECDLSTSPINNQKPSSVSSSQLSSQTSKLQQSKSNFEARKSLGNALQDKGSESESHSVRSSISNPSDTQSSKPVKSIENEKSAETINQRLQSKTNSSVEVPREQKERSRLPSSFRNLVSAFETKAKSSEEQQQVKRPSFRSALNK